MLVSVVVPTYNRSEAVRLAVTSVLAQNHKNTEVVVIDDCSPDNTSKVLLGLVRQDSRVRMFRTPRNSGVSAARNMGILQSRGEYITFLDDDDAISGEYLSAISFIGSACEPDICQVIHTHAQSTADFVHRTREWSDWSVNGYLRTFAFRRVWLLGNSIFFPEKYNLCEDHYFKFLAWANADRLAEVESSGKYAELDIPRTSRLSSKYNSPNAWRKYILPLLTDLTDDIKSRKLPAEKVILSRIFEKELNSVRDCPHRLSLMKKLCKIDT